MMKTHHYPLLALAVLAAATFTACSHDTDMYSPEQAKQITYEAAFRQTFGPTIDSRNDWGFGDTRVSDDDDETPAEAPALTRGTDGAAGNGVTRAAKDPDQRLYYSGRVFCEDLGSIGDFDFNDVVFDARIYQSGRIEIIVQAAGGTLPVSVAGQRVTMGTMVNTGVNKADPQTINIPAATAKANGWTQVKDIPVVISGTSQAGDVVTYELTANAGQAPQKICTHIGPLWPDEYVRIDRAYPKFKEYVAKYQTIWTSELYPNLVDQILTNND